MKKNQTTKKIRVMVVDDHAGVREALRNVINLQPDLEVVAEAESGRVALRLLPRVNPNVILMDGSMPEMSGIETTQRLKQIRPEAKIIGLTLYGESTYLEEMVAVGASGYLKKTGSPEDVFNAIRIVSDGGTFFDPDIPRRAVAVLNRPKPTSTQKLTSNEIRVAKLVAEGKTNREIADSLGLKLHTVERRRAAAMKKLDVRSRAALVRLAVQHHWLDE